MARKGRTREAGSIVGRGKALEGRKPRRAAARDERPATAIRVTDSEGDQSPEDGSLDARWPGIRKSGRRVEAITARGQRLSDEGSRLLTEGKALKGEPQERCRHETRPAGAGRRNPPRGYKP
jgi:hypothetical protein